MLGLFLLLPFLLILVLLIRIILGADGPVWLQPGDSNSMQKAFLLSPVLLTLLLALWTALVYKYSSNGSWHIYPALAILPLVLVCHIALIVLKTPRVPFVLYTVLHVIVLVPLWIGCLMLISKDSL